MKKISEGAEAYIYLAKFMDSDAIIKDRIQKRYRAKEIDTDLRNERTKREARILVMASESGVMVPMVLLLDRYQIFMNRIHGRNLNKLLENKIDNGKLFGVAAKCGKYLAMLHNADIAHGDYTPANILVDKRNVWVIDFGLSEITKSVEGKALDILLMKRSLDTELFRTFIDRYRKTAREASATIKRLEEIERRGRYQARTLLTA